MAAEMQMLGSDVHVSAIEPGNYKSKIGDSMCRRAVETGQLDTQSRWQPYYDRMKARCTEQRENTNPEPDDVADAALHAMFDPSPKEHYMVVPEQWQAEITIRKAIEELVELNRDHAFSYSRDDLVQMLDEELEAGDAFEQSLRRARD